MRCNSNFFVLPIDPLKYALVPYGGKRIFCISSTVEHWNTYTPNDLVVAFVFYFFFLLLLNQCSDTLLVQRFTFHHQRLHWFLPSIVCFLYLGSQQRGKFVFFRFWSMICFAMPFRLQRRATTINHIVPNAIIRPMEWRTICPPHPNHRVLRHHHPRLICISRPTTWAVVWHCLNPNINRVVRTATICPFGKWITTKICNTTVGLEIVSLPLHHLPWLQIVIMVVNVGPVLKQLGKAICGIEYTRFDRFLLSPKRPYAPSSITDIRLNDLIKFSRPGGKISKGIVKYVGTLPGKSDQYLGLELEDEGTALNTSPRSDRLECMLFF